MNIRGIHGSGALASTGAVDPKPASRHSSIPPAPDAAAAKTHISGPGQLFSQLQQLAEQDPERFKQVAQQISDQLSATAESSTGRARDLAQKLADRFGQAAQSGDLSPFQPGGDRGSDRGGVGRPHHHHQHHHGHHLGGGEAVRSVLENALDLVHQALTAPASNADAGSVSSDVGAAGDASVVSADSSAGNASVVSADGSAGDASATSDASTSATPNPALETAS